MFVQNRTVINITSVTAKVVVSPFLVLKGFSSKGVLRVGLRRTC